MVISSGAVVGTAAYLFWLSGAIIADAKPYHDDRSTTERIMGPIVTVSYFAWPALFVARVFGKVHFWSGHGRRAVLLLLVQGTLLVLVELYSEKANRMRSPMLAEIDKSVEEALVDVEPLSPSDCQACEGWRHILFSVVDFVEKRREPLVRFLVVPALTFLALFLGIKEFMSNDAIWAGFFGAELFVCFVLTIGLLSLFIVRRGEINLYFKGGSTPPMKRAVLLKVGTDFIRIIHEGSVYLIAKDAVLRMESKLDAKRYMGEKDALEISR